MDLSEQLVAPAATAAITSFAKLTTVVFVRFVPASRSECQMRGFVEVCVRSAAIRFRHAFAEHEDEHDPEDEEANDDDATQFANKLSSSNMLHDVRMTQAKAHEFQIDMNLNSDAKLIGFLPSFFVAWRSRPALPGRDQERPRA